MRLYVEAYLLLASSFNYTGSSALAHLHERGIFTAYWVINDPEIALEALDTGV